MKSKELFIFYAIIMLAKNCKMEVKVYIFDEEFSKFIKEFGSNKLMVLSTSLNDKVTSRMMSIVLIHNKFYFQTDKNFRKYEQIIHNPSVSLCIDNIQIDGICEEVGKPSDNKEFIEVFKNNYSSSYEMYTNRDSERLFEVKAEYIERWKYFKGVPYLESFDIKSKKYSLKEYK